MLFGLWTSRQTYAKQNCCRWEKSAGNVFQPKHLQILQVPQQMKFFPLEQSLVQPKHPGEEMHMPDMAKFGRSEQLHLAVQAVMAYREKTGELPAVRDAKAAEQCVALAKEINEARKKQGGLLVWVMKVVLIDWNTVFFCLVGHYRCYFSHFFVYFLGPAIFSFRVDFFSPRRWCCHVSGRGGGRRSDEGGRRDPGGFDDRWATSVGFCMGFVVQYRKSWANSSRNWEGILRNLLYFKPSLRLCFGKDLVAC